MGAEVLKVEDPAHSDWARGLNIVETTQLHEAVNGGKQSITIDLTKQRGRDVFYNLIEDADVVVEQFRPGVVDRLEVDYETLTDINDELIYCSISGYGQTGPNRDLAGHDLNYLGFSGFLDMNRSDETATPTLPGFPIGDMSGGLFAACNIMHRLLLRELSENPQSHYIDIAINEAVLALSQMVGVSALTTACRPGKTLLTGQFPCYDIYRTSDDEFVTLAALEPKFWKSLCTSLDREDLLDRHLSDDPAVRSALRDELSEIFAERSQKEWLEQFASNDIPLGKVQSVKEAFSDPQFIERGVFTSVEDTKRVITPGLQKSSVASETQTTPGHGEHTEHILDEAGFSENEIEDHATNDVI
jgi:crotonobetainyl-CoA:carnitine CoA-transferase CaiB-like acyl-CoA transferase